MSEVNETVEQVQSVNEEVETAPEAAGDAEALTFDDLDNLTDTRSAKEIVSEAKKEVKTSTKEDKSQDEGLGNEEADQVAKEEDKKDASKKEENTEEDTEEEEYIKKIMGKSGKKKYELNPDTIFKHKVDGEDVDVSLQDLLNNYSGKMSYDKRFQEFSSERTRYQEEKERHDTEITEIKGYIDDFAHKIKNEDALGALEYFAEFAGMKPYEFRTELVRQISPEVERRSIMSPEEIENENLRAQNDYLIRQQESEVNNKTTEQSQQELGRDIRRIQEAHDIADDDFSNAYRELLKSEFDGEITPAVVGEYYVHTQAFSKAESILSQIDTTLAENDQIIESFQKVIVENPSFDDDDLNEIVREVYGDYKKEASEKVSKKLAVSEKPEKKSRGKEDILSFEDF